MVADQIEKMTGRASARKGRKKGSTIVVDCTKPVDDMIMQIASLEKNIKERGGDENTITRDKNTITRDKNKITVTSDGPFSKRYSRYMTKRYLKVHDLQDWLRVKSPNKDSCIYELRYFNIEEN